MKHKQPWWAVALVISSLSQAGPNPDQEFDEIHFAPHPGSSVMAVTVIFRAEPIWHLWPEDIQVTHVAKSADFALAYAKHAAPPSILVAASTEAKLAPACQKEAERLINPPTIAVADDKLTTTIFIPLAKKSPERLSLSASPGLKILRVETFSPEANSTVGEPVELESWTRAILLEVDYETAGDTTFGPSDFVISRADGTENLSVTLQKPGLAALKVFTEDHLLSDGCAASLNKQYWAPPETPAPGNLQKKSASCVFLFGDKAPRQLTVEGGRGLAIKDISPLD